MKKKVHPVRHPKTNKVCRTQKDVEKAFHALFGPPKEVKQVESGSLDEVAEEW